MKIPVTLRLAEPADVPGIRNLLLTAFPTPAESELVELLRRDGDAIYEIVAVSKGAVGGYCLFSRMRGPFPALGLGPLAVAPHLRRRGIGRQLIERGITRAKRDLWGGVFVLGDPAYYGKAGFEADLGAGFDCRFAGPHFMCRALSQKGLPATKGALSYAPAFDMFD